MNRIAKLVLLYVVALVIASLMGIPIVGELLLFPLALTFGWILFLWKTLPHVRIVWPDVALGCIAALALVVAIQGLARSLQRTIQLNRGSLPNKSFQWPIGRSIMLSLLVLISFVTGTAVVGFVHQVVWLATSDQPLWSQQGRRIASRAQAMNVEKELALGVLNYASRSADTLPAGATTTREGLHLHGWLTEILPFLGEGVLYDAIDKQVPWQAKKNAMLFRRQIPAVLNPRMEDPAAAEVRGFGAAHFAANRHVIGPGTPLTVRAIKDGVSRTFLGGEVSAALQPWGSTCNWRDPAVGLHQPMGFSGPRNDRGTIMMMCDNSVRHVSRNIDHRVLRALATPDGGEELSKDDLEH